MNRSLGLLAVLSGFALVACSAASSDSTAAFTGGTSDASGSGTYNAGTAPGASSSSGSSGTDGTTSPGTPSPGAPQSNLLTAGVWDDNLNYDFFGKFLGASAGQASASIFSPSERDAAHARAMVPATAKTELDVMLVLDTTSSMGDELTFLQAEFRDIAAAVQAKFPQVAPRFSLVVYRDHVDEYLTRQFDFSTDVATFQTNLAAQSAAGGGDLPEAVPEGLGAGVSQSWRTDENVARVMFWVADAPQHPGEETKVHDVVASAQQKGIHIYPVASSDADGSAELTMRDTAQLTGGRYLFLTDDSGVGNSHAEPHIPCYVVTSLNTAIVRMVETEMTGTRAEATTEQILRTVGDPVDGKCTTASSGQVVLY